MATVTLKPNTPVSLKKPEISITGMTKPGKYVFTLVVTDKTGIESDPTTFEVTVNRG